METPRAAHAGPEIVLVEKQCLSHY